MAHIVFIETTRPGIQAIEAAKRMGHKVSFVTSGKFDWLLTPSEFSAIRESVDSIYSVSSTQSADDCEHALRECMSVELIDAVLTVFHPCVLPATIAAARLGLKATSVQGVMNARDKARCRDLVQQAGLPSVQFKRISSFEEARLAAFEIGYPIIVKPSTGLAKMMVKVIENEQALADYFELYNQSLASLDEAMRKEIDEFFVVEEVAVGPLFSIEVGVSAHNEWMPLAILRRKTGLNNPVLEMGSTMPSGLSDDQYQAAADYAIAIVKALGLDLGIFHVEFIYTTSGPRLVEVNPRIAGGSIPDLINAATGVNLFELLVRVHTGERLGLGRLASQIYSSHSFIAVEHDCTVREDLPDDWFSPIKAELHSGTANISAGQFLQHMEGNFSTYGVIRVSGNSYDEVVEKVSIKHAEVEEILGVKLVPISN